LNWTLGLGKFDSTADTLRRPCSRGSSALFRIDYLTAFQPTCCKVTLIEKPALSLVIPCYNESEVLPLLQARLQQSLNSIGVTWEVIFIDDGSTDGTLELLAALHRVEPRFKVVSFSRNFGHQAAICAGLFYASGSWLGVMDADLQDPPEMFSQCLQKMREGYDVVYAVRRHRKENMVRRAAYALFYRLLKFMTSTDIPLDAGDFCLMDRRVADVLRRLPERNIFVRGLRAWTGFRQIGLEYDRDARAAGKTKYPFRKLAHLAADGIFAFSTLPLRLAIYLGFATVALSLFMAVFTLFCRVFGVRFMGHAASELPGWATLAVGMFFFGGVQLLILGCIGEYIGRIYTEVKQRPRWVTRETWGLETDQLGRQP
jgi:dolichol-phosphate mannosyltransferase